MMPLVVSVAPDEDGASLDASEEAERALAAVVLGMRTYHLASAGVSLWLDRPRYRRPGLATAALAAVAAESAWLFWRHQIEHRPLDRLSMIVDVGSGAAAFALCAPAVRADEQFTPVNWAFPMNVWHAIGAAAGFSRSGGVAATGVLVGTYAISTAVQSGGLKTVATVAGALEVISGWVIGDLVVRRLRRTAVEITALHDETVERAAAVAEETVRVNLSQELHRRAVDTLEQIRELLIDDGERARHLARLEAARLRRALRGEGTQGLAGELEGIASDAVRRGLVVDLITSDVGSDDDLPGTLIKPLADAIRAVLAGCDPAEDGEQVLLHASAALEGGLELSLRYRGPYRESAGAETIAAAIDEVGGTFRLTRPGSGGVRVVITMVGKP